MQKNFPPPDVTYAFVTRIASDRLIYTVNEDNGGSICITSDAFIYAQLDGLWQEQCPKSSGEFSDVARSLLQEGRHICLVTDGRRVATHVWIDGIPPVKKAPPMQPMVF